MVGGMEQHRRGGRGDTAPSAPPGATGVDGETLQPVGAHPLWNDPDPLWAVGDWRPDEVRVVSADEQTRIAVLGTCGASDEQLRVALFAARGGALRHLTAWPGSYTAVVQVGRRITVCGDLAGARPVFHTTFERGVAYATAALPARRPRRGQPRLRTPRRAARGARRPRRAPGLHPVRGREARSAGARADPARRGPGDRRLRTRRLAGRRRPARRPRPRGGRRARRAGGGRADPAGRAPSRPRRGHGPRPGAGHGARGTARRAGTPVAGIGADLSGGPASGALALLAAGLPGRPGTVLGHGTGAGERLLAVTFNDLAARRGRGRDEGELERAGALAANPRLHHVVVAGEESTLPYVDLDVPLTDEPGPSLVAAARHRARLAAGSADHFTGYGAKQVLDAHPARLADLLMDRKRRHLVRPVAALAKADGSVMVPARVYAAARRLARTPYRTGLESLAQRLLHRKLDDDGPGGAADASLAALTWGRPGPAARWLTGEALAEVSVRLQASTWRSEVGPGQRPGTSGRGRRSRGTRRTCGCWNRRRRSAPSGCTRRSSTTRWCGRAGPCRRRCGYGRGRGRRSCGPCWRVRGCGSCPRGGARRARRPRRPPPRGRGCEWRRGR